LVVVIGHGHWFIDCCSWAFASYDPSSGQVEMSAKAGAALMKFLPGFLLDALLKIND